MSVSGPRLDGRRSGRREPAMAGLPVVAELPVGPAFVRLAHEDIAARAYAHYEARNRNQVNGDADGDWHRAVAELRGPK